MKNKLTCIIIIVASILSFDLTAQDASFYLKYAQKGDTEAMCKLGHCYINGEGGVDQNTNEALYWYEKAAKKGYPKGLYNVACYYFYSCDTYESFMKSGWGYLKKALKKDYAPAYWLYAQLLKSQNDKVKYLSSLKYSATIGGYAVAQTEYGLLYLYGAIEYGISQDVSVGVAWLRKSAENNNAEALYHLGTCYDNGTGVQQNRSTAIEYYIKSAQLGNAAAQAQVGRALLLGDGMEVDYASAYKYFAAAAAQDNAFAYSQLGNIYYYGAGVEINYSSAKEMYDTAIKLGDPYSMCKLASMYLYGIGVEQNYDLAYKNYKEAANLDYPNGQLGMGICYMYGYGVPKIESVGVEWYKKSANQNNTDAMYRLAYCYRDGVGIEKNRLLFLYTLEKAANLGYTKAKAALGYEYYVGEAIIGGANIAKSVEWFKEAAKDGEVYAEAILGTSYYLGTDLCTEKDYTQSYIYLSSAVINSDYEFLDDSLKATVYRCLAGSYRYGRGCTPDQSLASYYTEQAAKYGDEGSKRATGLIRRDLEN